MIKIGIIGCGKIADAHAAQIQRINGCEIVGACDREELMAKQFCERYYINQYYIDPKYMIKETKPNIIHITTPPQSHFELGKMCLEAGCHVYMEKPFTIYTEEAENLINLSNEKNLKITVGHDAAFNHAERSMRELIKNGYLGGNPIHMECYYCYELDDAYANSLTGDKEHWVRKLPGQLLQNVISHGICAIAEHLTFKDPDVIAHGFSSTLLKKLKENEIVDELRVIINEKDCITAYFTFSSQIRPALHQFRIFGPKNGIIVDSDHQTCIRMPGNRYKSYLNKFVPPINYAKQYSLNTFKNMKYFLKNDFHMKSGMKFLMESFYKSIKYNTPPPIPYNEIILTATIMDKIFYQIQNQKI